MDLDLLNIKMKLQMTFEICNTPMILCVAYLKKDMTPFKTASKTKIIFLLTKT